MSLVSSCSPILRGHVGWFFSVRELSEGEPSPSPRPKVGGKTKESVTPVRHHECPNTLPVSVSSTPDTSESSPGVP